MVEHRHENKALIIITAGYLITYVVSIDYLAQRYIMLFQRFVYLSAVYNEEKEECIIQCNEIKNTSK